MQTESRRNANNRLLWALFFISLMIHALMLMQIADSYQHKSTSVLEFTLLDTTPPSVRAIPRPRVRYTEPVVNNVKTLQVREYKVPQFKMDPVESPVVDTIVEPINMPDTPHFSSPHIAAWAPPSKASTASSAPLMTRQEYMNMLRLKIEQHKQYPQSARIRQIQGRVIIRFIITKDGLVESVEVVNSAGNASLDRAALNAVRQAAPFPPLPANIFHTNDPIEIEIAIVFQLS